MKSIIFLLLIFIVLSTSGYSISVASDYLVNDTMELVIGTSKIYGIRLQNPTDYKVGIKIDYDGNFIKVIDYKEVYDLEPKTTGYKILLNVTAPKNATVPGSVYTVGYTVGEVEPSGGGGIGLRLKINKNFKLKVVSNPEKFSTKDHINYDYLIYTGILLLPLLYVILNKKLKKNVKTHPKIQSKKFKDLK